MNKLIRVSFVGAVAVFGMSNLFVRKYENKIKSSSIYKEALEIVKTHKGAVHVLGEPIEDVHPHIKNSSSLLEIDVTLKGSKTHGKLFLTAIGNSPYTLELDTIQLQVGNDESRRLIIKEPSPRLLEKTTKVDFVYL